MTELRLKTFSAISDFVNDLESVFSQIREVRLYNRLIEKTTFRDTQAIDRHISAFKTMFDTHPKWDGLVEYSKKVFLDLHLIFSKASQVEKVAVYNHLKVIYTLVYKNTPEEKQAMEKLKTSANLVVPPPKKLELGELPNLPNTAEGDFIRNTLGEITQHINPNSQNPMEMVAGLMQSGFFNNFVGDLQTKFTNGEINISNLVNTVSTVITETAPEGEQGDQIRNMLNMATQAIPKEKIEEVNGNVAVD